MLHSQKFKTRVNLKNIQINQIRNQNTSSDTFSGAFTVEQGEVRRVSSAELFHQVPQERSTAWISSSTEGSYREAQTEENLRLRTEESPLFQTEEGPLFRTNENLPFRTEDRRRRRPRAMAPVQDY